jgi:osmotically-inducible protein OsmY
MNRLAAIPIVFFSVWISAGCAPARKNSTGAKEPTAAAGQNVGDKTEDAATNVAETTTDATITAAVKMKFAADRTIDTSKIDVDTKDHLVTLTGTVYSKVAADKAVALARRVEGVKGVARQLTIEGQ